MGQSKTDVVLIDRLLSVISDDIVPRTRIGVSKGNKVFGAAVLLKKDLSVIVAETNNETENPLWHGEIHCLKGFYDIPEEDRPLTKDCLFLSTHEPCSMCLSGITWAGFDNFYYLFSYEDTRDAFQIPHDLNILDQVFRVKEGDYRRTNAYWQSQHLSDMVAKLPEAQQPDRLERLNILRETYAALSEAYQIQKVESGKTISLG